MAPEPWRSARSFRCFAGAGAREGPRGRFAPRDQARSMAAHRGDARIALLALVIAQTDLRDRLHGRVLPYHGRQPLELGILALFAILILLGVGGLLDRDGRVSCCCCAARSLRDLGARRGRRRRSPPQARTAIVMPICNEDVARVFAGLRATYESLARTGELDHFDFFVLSDSSDPDTAHRRARSMARRVPRASTASAASSTAAASVASSARAATSPTSAGAGAKATTTWSCSTPTA